MNSRPEFRRRAFKKGLRAEKVASFWLRLQLYHIVARRFKTRVGEIDLIARRGDQVLIVEIKARSNLQSAMEAFSWQQQQRIEAAADLWLMRQKDYGKLCLRFDLIAIVPWRFPVHIPAFFDGRG